MQKVRHDARALHTWKQPSPPQASDCQRTRAGFPPQGGEIASEYSNAWIDMRHDNALNSTMSELRDHCYRRAGLPYATAAVPQD